MNIRQATLACLAALAAGPAAAQDGGWTFAATGYLWLPSIRSTVDTDLGSIESTLDASDALSDLNFGFMGTVSAQKDRWSVIGDFVYSDSTASSSTPHGLVFTKASTDTRLSILSGYAAYRVAETDEIALDLGAGFRAIGMDINTTLSGNNVADRSFGGNDTWVVPLIAARAIVPLADRWSATVMGDFGGTGSDEISWQALTSIDYAINDKWTATLAYRYLDIEKPVGGNDTKVELYGPALGVTYRF
jgi:opacity protein-like surface antigen